MNFQHEVVCMVQSLQCGDMHADSVAESELTVQLDWLKAIICLYHYKVDSSFV